MSKKFSILVKNHEDHSEKTFDVDRLVLLCPDIPEECGETEGKAAFQLTMQGFTGGDFSVAMLGAILLELTEQFQQLGMADLIRMHAAGKVHGFSHVLEGGDKNE